MQFTRIIPVARRAFFAATLLRDNTKKETVYHRLYISTRASHLRLAFLESIFLRSTLRDPESKTVAVHSRSRPQTTYEKQRGRKNEGRNERDEFSSEGDGGQGERGSELRDRERKRLCQDR